MGQCEAKDIAIDPPRENPMIENGVGEPVPVQEIGEEVSARWIWRVNRSREWGLRRAMVLVLVACEPEGKRGVDVRPRPQMS